MTLHESNLESAILIVRLVEWLLLEKEETPRQNCARLI